MPEPYWEPGLLSPEAFAEICDTETTGVGVTDWFLTHTRLNVSTFCSVTCLLLWVFTKPRGPTLQTRKLSSETCQLTHHHTLTQLLSYHQWLLTEKQATRE